MENFKNNENNKPSKAEIYTQKLIKFFKELPKVACAFIKNAPEKCLTFLKAQYKNPVFYLVVIVVILFISNIVLFRQVKDLEENLDYTNSEIERVDVQTNGLEHKIKEIEDKLDEVENRAHSHYW